MKRQTADTALTIAGSDTSGGAGIQADLKTFAAHKIFGKSVITSITAQNTTGVRETFDLPVDVVAGQLDAVLEDGKPLAVKTGMLGNEAVVECVAARLRRYRIKKLVVDPVIRSSSGKRLLTQKGVRALREQLLPLALVVTPNLKEAEILSDIRISTPADRLKAARVILKSGVKNVLITGGHWKGAPEDLFHDGRKPVVLASERLPGGDWHGTGCVFSAAVTAGLAAGDDLSSAVRAAKDFILQAIAGGVLTGKGMGSVEPLTPLYRSRERFDLLQRVSAAVETLKEARIGSLIPEVQSNIGVGLEGARSHQDVIAFPGRIVKKGKDIVTLASPAFGASRHVANIVLTAMRYDPSKRAVMNIRFTDELLKICKQLKFKIGSFDRAEEPASVRKREGSSLEWGTENAIRKCGFVPDIIFDRGGHRKEEMIRVLAEDIESLVEKILKIHRRFKG